MIAAMIAVTGSAAALATEYTKGKIKKVDMKAGKVTIIHEELTNLDMPAMTMVFRAADPAMLEKMNPGDDIEFIADRVKGKLTVTELK
jgi:Cu/Ag efflux protein CusF